MCFVFFSLLMTTCECLSSVSVLVFSNLSLPGDEMLALSVTLFVSRIINCEWFTRHIEPTGFYCLGWIKLLITLKRDMFSMRVCSFLGVKFKFQDR